MTQVKAYLKRALPALFLLFISISCSQKCHQWEYRRITTACHQFDSSRLSLTPECETKELGLEISRTMDADIRMYINVYSLIIPSSDEFPNQALVTLLLPDTGGNYYFYAEILEGNQKLLLPNEAANYLINRLLNDQPFTLQVGRYSTDAIFTGFRTGFKTLQGA